MKKRTIGQVLRLSRVNLHLSLQDVSNKTAIGIPYIEALENDEFDLLPSPFYAQIYLKKLAWALGLDESILLTAFREGKELLFDEEILVDDESELVTNPVLSTSEFCHPWLCDLYRIFL